MVVSMTSLPTEFATGHIGLNVTDLDRSLDFYAEVFGWELKGRGDADGSRYAFLGDTERLVLTLWEQSSGACAKDQPGMHHLSFQVGEIADVLSAEQRVRALGAKIYHDGIVPHNEGESSGGIFFEDPDGIRLEIYAPAGAGAHHRAPYGSGPTCGFF